MLRVMLVDPLSESSDILSDACDWSGRTRAPDSNIKEQPWHSFALMSWSRRGGFKWLAETLR
jgi:hypothetical protein